MISGVEALIGILRSRSLRFWVAMGMVIAIVPLFISAVGGFLLLNRGVIAPFDDVALRQREQSAPIQHLRLLVWETLPPVDEFAEKQNHVAPPTYRAVREEIEAEFARLAEALQGEPATLALLERARENWTLADRHATDIISVVTPASQDETAATLQRFHGQVEATNDKLTGVYDRIGKKISDDHDAALRSYDRSIWVAGIAGVFSLLAMAVGVLIVGRILSASVDRLVKGAVRFAEGDRQHRIEIALPPELHRVAEEFNDMIGRIHESEEALSRLAHHDTLTGLGNRRSFDEAFREAQDREKRHGEQAALLAIDIDHFKRINDQFGHGVGDDVLRAIAGIMLRNVRPADKVFRIGGEEFVALLPAAGASQAREVANRIREAISSTPVPVDDGTIDVSVSIGVATTAQAREQDEVMKLADMALYEAKKAGRNRVVVDGESQAA